MSDPIVIADYDPQWAKLFEEAKAWIAGALRALDVQVEHIGSTSVPGLAAKPIIDLMIIVANVEDAIRAITPLVSLDYVCRGEAGIPGRIFFRKGAPRSHHIHLYPRGHPEIGRHLLFRDYLRSHPDAMCEYSKLKRALAEKFGNDMTSYTEAKTEFIRSTEGKAGEELHVKKIGSENF